MSTMQQILDSARTKLIADSSFAALIGTDVGKSASGKPFSDGWVFKANDPTSSPYIDTQNTGTSSVVMELNRSWTTPNRHNSARFRLLSVDVYSDQTRAIDVNLKDLNDAEFRCDRVAKAVIDVFNDVANNDHWWPDDVFIVSSVLWSDLTISYVPGTDGLVNGSFSFALTV